MTQGTLSSEAERCKMPVKISDGTTGTLTNNVTIINGVKLKALYEERRSKNWYF